MKTVTLPSVPREVGPFLRALRVQLGIKQEDVCFATASSQSVISSLENGHTAPMFVTVMSYLRAIGCTLEISLASGEDMPEVRPTKAGSPRVKVYVPRGTKPEPRQPTRCPSCLTDHNGECP